MGDTVRITDVAPRDGLQNEEQIVDTTEKVRLVELLSRTGVDEIEVTSFVSPKWVPQLGDAREVFSELEMTKRADLVYSALVPNEKGMRQALRVNEDAGHMLLDKIALFTAASETFSQRNTNASVEETYERFKPVIASAKEQGFALRGYISCAIECPFEGPIDPAAVGRVAIRLCELGIGEIDLGDTIGAGTPETTKALVESVQKALADAGHEPLLTLHLHDTHGRAASCVEAALDLGIRSFDGAAGGLGGCPFASTDEERAPGNINMSTLVQTIEGKGFKTNIDGEALAAAANYARELLEHAEDGLLG